MIHRNGALSYRPMTNPPRLPNRNELKAIAHRAMIQRGLQPDFSPAVLEETHAFAKAAAETDPSIRDLRSLLWASIDNDDSRDLDQLSVAEPMAHGATKILVAVADVDALVKEGSAIDGHARTNTTSVYTAAEVFPMLPEKLSTDLTSLGEGQARLAIVIEMVVAVNGMVTRFDVYRAVVLNRAKLAYHSVAAWLEGTAPAPPELAASLGEHLPLEPRAHALEEFLARRRQADPARFPDLSLAVVKLLGPGEYAVELPDGRSEGHFGLAVRDYTHSTAPNRRFPDLAMQRLLKAAIGGRPVPSSTDELNALARHCTEQEDNAAKVERQVRKSAAALLLASRIGERFDAIVTGASAKGTWVRILQPAVEGKVVSGFEGLDVGDRVQVELVRTDVEHGFIDFVRARPTAGRSGIPAATYSYGFFGCEPEE